MKKYPKNVLTSTGFLDKFASAGLIITDPTSASNAINEIGFYRLRGYSFHLLDPTTNKYIPGTTFDSILSLYRFDCELRKILFDISCKIEVALRSHLCEALLQTQSLPIAQSAKTIDADPLIYLDASVFYDKKDFWQNIGLLSSEIARSRDVFIQHNFDKHDGQIPLWAAVEVMSFGTLSKFISNLKTGKDSAFQYLAKFYTYKARNGADIIPRPKMLFSWIHTTVILRNMCAHNSRIYNRSFSIKPELLDADAQIPTPRYTGLYHLLLAMKYIRPSDQEWKDFVQEFCNLLNKYKSDVDLTKLHLPTDWESHINIV